MEKDTRKLMRVYVKPETESDIIEWAENQQNVGIAIKTLIRMAIAIRGKGDILTLPFGVNALETNRSTMRNTKDDSKPKEAKKETYHREPVVESENKENDDIDDIRSSYYGNTQGEASDEKEDANDMDIFGAL